MVKSRKEVLGVFIGQPFYMKLYDSIKGSHMNYKVSNLERVVYPCPIGLPMVFSHLFQSGDPQSRKT